MMIAIKKLRAQTMLGAYAEERLTQRTVVINLHIVFDHASGVASDRLQDTLDYAEIEKNIIESLNDQHFVLLESLAAHVAKLVLAFPQAEEVTVEVEKPGALRHADCVAVTCRMTR